MDESTERQIREELERLRHKHRNLAAGIEVLSADGKTDPFTSGV